GSVRLDAGTTKGATTTGNSDGSLVFLTPEIRRLVDDQLWHRLFGAVSECGRVRHGERGQGPGKCRPMASRAITASTLPEDYRLSTIEPVIYESVAVVTDEDLLQEAEMASGRINTPGKLVGSVAND